MLIALITTAIRILGQLMIPSYEQNVLMPSIFVQKGILPLVFSLYAFFSYSIIAAMYLLLENKIPGKRIAKGLKYGFAYCLIWTVYLLEPLPHSEGAELIHIISYPLADGIALIVLGFLIGVLLAEDGDKPEEKQNAKMNKAGAGFGFAFSCFFVGRVFLYAVLDVYSSIDTQLFETILWVTITGVSVSAVLIWLGQFIVGRSRVIRAALVGCVLFGVNLTIFNFFVPLALASDITDVLVRTLVDIFFVTAGMLLLPENKAICEKTI